MSHRLEKSKCLPSSWKNGKLLIEDSRPISLLPVCGMILERLIYNKMFDLFTENELIYRNQSSFLSGNSCVNQLLCVTRNIYQLHDDSLKTRDTFLDILKAFVEAWHESVLYKLKENGISGNLLNVITDCVRENKELL